MKFLVSCISCDRVRSGVGSYVSISLSYSISNRVIVLMFAQPQWHVSLQRTTVIIARVQLCNSTELE